VLKLYVLCDVHFGARHDSGVVATGAGHIVAVADAIRPEAIACQQALIYNSDQGVSFF
jgi:hypothetical protein